MDNQEALFSRLAAERAARTKDPAKQKARDLLGLLFAEQRALIEDPSRRKTLLCPGRSGKSYCFAVYILRALLTIPRANVLYVVFIRSQAKEILWNMLKAMNEEFQLRMHFGEAELTVTNGKGAWARLAGCESWGDTDKLRGVPRHLVILDEAATWHAALLKDLVRDVIEPRLGDYKGTLILGGTPGAVLAGMFYEATGPVATTIGIGDEGQPLSPARPYAERDNPKWKGVEFGWSLHGWPLSANTSEQGKNALEEAYALKRRNGWSDDHPVWVREYLGRWMADDSKLVFRYEPGRDDWVPGPRTAENPFGLPEGHAWRFCICADMGFHDPFALQVGAYSDTHPDLHQVYEYEATRLTVSGVAEAVHKVLGLIEEHEIESMTADLQGLGGMVVETLAVEHGIHFEKLEQRDKRDRIELVNAGLVDRRIRIMRGSRLASEMLYLAWDPTGLKTRPNQANHHCDAFNGVVCASRHYDATPAIVGPAPGSAAFLNAAAKDEEEAVAARRRRRHGNGGLDDGDGGTNDSDDFYGT